MRHLVPPIKKQRRAWLMVWVLAVAGVVACGETRADPTPESPGDAGSNNPDPMMDPKADGGGATLPQGGGGQVGEGGVPALAGGPSPLEVEVPTAPSDARSVSVVLGASATGQKASQRIGIGIHNYAPQGSNTSLYLERLGVNATRVFGAYLLSTTLDEYFGGRDLDGEVVQTHAAFNAACKALSGAPEGPSWKKPIAWADIRSRMGKTGVGLLPTIDEQVRLGTDLDLQLSPPSGFQFSTYDSASAAYWQERWSLYVYYYAEARVAAQHGARTFELINEPDLLSYTEDRLRDLSQIASRAVQAAAADLGLVVRVLGPTFGRNGADLDNAEYGPFLAYLHERFGAGPSSKWSNVQGLAYHRYSGGGALFSSIAESLASFVGAHADVPLPLYITEFNAHTGADWATRDDSPDAPAAASRFLAEAVALSDKVEGQYAFLMAMYGSLDRVQKNGIHWVDNSVEPAGNIGGRTRSAAAFALFARSFAGGAPLWQLELKGAADGQLALATANADRVAVLLVNDSTSAMDVRVDFSALELSPDAVAAWQAVDADHRGETVARYALGSPRALSQTVPESGVALVTVPRGAGPFAHLRYPALAAAQLRAGSLQDSPQGENGTLEVRTDAAGDNARTSVALVQFAPSRGQYGTEAASIRQATLQLRLAAAGKQPCVLHAFGAATVDWRASDITWASSRILKPLPDAVSVNAIAKNFVDYAGAATLAFLGDLDVPVGTPAGAALQLDMTDFARASAAGFSVLVVREFMNDGTKDANPAADSLTDSWATLNGGVGTDDPLQPALFIEAW